MPPDESQNAPIIDARHYVPILKGRAAEYDALEVLDDTQRAALTPLIEVMPIPWDVEKDRAKINGEKHIENAEQNLLRAWGPSRPVLVDLRWLGPEARTTEGQGQHPMAFLLQRAAAADLKIVPVVSMDSDAEYREAVREGQDGHGIGLRLTTSDLAGEAAADHIRVLLDEVQSDPQATELLVDLKELNTASADFNVIGAMGVLAAIPEITAWRSVILAGSAFPPNLSEMQPASTKRFPRAEWKVWTTVRRREIARVPTFSDYAIAHPDLPPAIDPKLLRVSAQLRYTAENDWLVFKQRNIRDFGNEQFISICKTLVNTEDYQGPDFSWGDGYIAQRANGSDVRPGNPRMWRKVGTNHHLAMVTSQIASLDA